MLVKLILLFFICNNFAILNATKDDLYSSITAFEKIFKTDSHLLLNLEDYIYQAEYKIDILKSILSKLQSNSKNFNSSNVLTQYAGTNYLIQAKKNFESITNDAFGMNIVHNITQHGDVYPFPSDDDLSGTILGLYRIQDFYNISSINIINGEFLNEKQNFSQVELSASDCFQVGYKLYTMSHYKVAVGWLKEALHKFPNETSQLKAPIKKLSILDFLCYSTFWSDKDNVEVVKTAIGYTKHALELEPNSEQIQNHLTYFISHLKHLEYYATLSQIDEESILLRKACQDQLKKTPEELRQLYCKYERDNHPFLRLAPIKVEIANLSPHIAIFHDVLYDSEISIIQDLARKTLVRAGVWFEKEGVGKPSNVRTSKFAWLKNDTHSLMHTLNQRISDMTGLTMETAEPLQVMNYGIGGHYDLHVDTFTEPDGKLIEPYGYIDFGNRISTVMFYLSDVEQGGATVYPWTKTIVKPAKGTAAFWMNGFASGDGDDRSRHSGCPVIMGSKWVANKWIRYRGQTFLRKCKKYDDKIKFDYISILHKIKKNIPLFK